jgi:hypothetical protein
VNPELKALLERIERLEKGTDVRLKHLPVQQLRQAILLDQPSDPTQILLPSSVTADVLSEDVVARLNP